MFCTTESMDVCALSFPLIMVRRPLQDTEPLPEVVKHQTNISELKRSFLETGGSGMPGLTEWEKRLSSSPLRSPRSDEAPMIEPLEPQDVSGRRRHDAMVVKHDVTEETGGRQ